MTPTGFLAVGAPGVASQDCDEGHEVEEGGDNREDHLHHQEFEGEFDLKGMDHIKDSVSVTIVCLTLMKSLT